MSIRIRVSKPMLEQWCRRHGVRRLAFFGSVLRDDFSAQSDVDVLAEFESDSRVGLITLAGMEIELGRILGRHVEIHTINGLHPMFGEQVLGSAEVYYERT